MSSTTQTTPVASSSSPSSFGGRARWRALWDEQQRLGSSSPASVKESSMMTREPHPAKDRNLAPENLSLENWPRELPISTPLPKRKRASESSNLAIHWKAYNRVRQGYEETVRELFDYVDNGPTIVEYGEGHEYASPAEAYSNMYICGPQATRIAVSYIRELTRLERMTSSLVRVDLMERRERESKAKERQVKHRQPTEPLTEEPEAGALGLVIRGSSPAATLYVRSSSEDTIIEVPDGHERTKSSLPPEERMATLDTPPVSLSALPTRGSNRIRDKRAASRDLSNASTPSPSPQKRKLDDGNLETRGRQLTPKPRNKRRKV